MKSFFVIFNMLFVLWLNGQQTAYVDFKTADVAVSIAPDSSFVSGSVAYTYDVLKPIDSIFIDAKAMVIDMVLLNNEAVDFTYKNDKIVVSKPFVKALNQTLLVKYNTKPKKALYFLKQNDYWNIWTQGQGKYTSNWLPSFDDVNEKLIFNLAIEAPKNYTILANGVSESIEATDKGKRVRFKMKHPMSSYLVALVIGNYDKKTATSNSGIPLEYYYYPEDSLKVEPTYRYSKQMFDFLEDEIGVNYPWQNYKQVPVHDFLYAGMENTSLTIFSDALVVDAIGFNDKNYVNVNAHELAHQWFGNLVTAKSGEHHWLQEGFATYYALLAERDIFGEDYFYFKLLESVIELSRQELSGQGTSLLDPKSSSLTFYKRGAFVLHVLKTAVGDVVFNKAVKNYLEKCQYGNVETSDFIKEVQRLHGKPLSQFENYWIKNKAFPYDDAYELLKQQSTFINEYAMVDCETKSSKCAEYLKYYVSDEAKAKVISQMPELITADVFKNGLKVRQAIAEHMTKIPEHLKLEYETLLDDKSYKTIESALYNLWVNFPLERSKYLAKTRRLEGFSDKSLRMLWIVLNLNTPYYEADNNYALLDELLGYTKEKYNVDVRINAFNYLNLIQSCNDACQANLELAKSHHNWRLVKFAKEFSNKIEEKKN
ncbi:M1 family metallopeptidase [Winogradskyella vidalii]|uniref:M1 family metallopeptidase n=1 Tax=Winogradskyella vidalii TaxID=2615024 RepID=UPI0015CBCB38|nr:M1 family metallopeptidase [Winogradskyella vidalii]